MAAPVISIEQMREWEKATWATGQTEAEVIRRVGKAVANCAMTLTRPGDLIVILAGTGHNGDDARCAREFLSDRRIDLLDVKDPEADFAKLESLLSLKPALIIDGLFGIGINRTLDPSWVTFIGTINLAGLQILSVDVPSGLNADTGKSFGVAIEPAVTLTIGTPKLGLLRHTTSVRVGRIEVARDVGLVPCPFTSDLMWSLPEDFLHLPPRRSATSHKGTFGHLAILAGSVGYHGAAVLAARGAQRGRPGLITLFTHESAYTPAASQLQAVMVHPWSTNTALPDDFSAFLIGPGLASPAVPDELKETARTLWSESNVPVIVDASALDWLPSGPIPNTALRVITPHPGEAARLLNLTPAQVQADRPKALHDLSRRFGDCWVVLKGAHTLVGRAGDDAIFVNSTGNPHLAQGGTGDLLSGFIAGLIVQPALQGDPLTTLRYAVFRHGAAAEQLSETRPNWVVEDLADAL